jgi:hypothetical protein
VQARYRSEYAGEFVILETKWSGGKKQQTREFIANSIENHHISGRAACIGSKADIESFDYTRLQRHRGGLLGSKKLQTYGVGTVTDNMRLDFTVETDPDRLKMLISNNYCENNIVYTSASNCIDNPEKFYLIPYNPRLLDLVSAAYLASFDGHKEIFLLGYTRDTPIALTEWYKQMEVLMNAYTGIKFYFVGEPTNMYQSWSNCANAEFMTYRNFISYCDV